MNNRKLVFLCILFSGACAISSLYQHGALGAPAPLLNANSPSVKLATQGVPGMSMATYGLITKEIGPPLDDTSGGRVKFNDFVRKSIADINEAKNPPLTQDAIANYVDVAKRSANELQQRATEIKEGRARDKETEVLQTGEIGLIGAHAEEKGAAFSAIGTTLLGLTALQADSKIEQQLKSLESEHSQKMSDLMTTALKKTREENTVLFEKIAQESSAEASASQGVDKLLGANKKLLDENFLSQLPEGAAREHARTGMILALRDAVGRARNLSAAESARLENNIAQTSKRLTQFEKNLGVLQKQTSEDFKQVRTALESNGKAITQIHQGMKMLEGKTTDIAQDITVMQTMMWGNLSNVEKLYAFDHGFMRDLTPQKRAEVRESLRKAADAETLGKDVRKALGYLEGAAGVAERLGIKIDQKELAKNIAVANAATSVVTNLMTGNTIGALMAAGGLFGGKDGPDIGEIRHQQVMAKLDEIVKLQQEILSAINQLSRQMATSTQQIMNELIGLKYDVSVVNSLLTHSQYGIATNACVEFQNRGRDYKMDALGRYSTYDDRTRHFEYDAKNLKHFAKCTSFLAGGIAQINFNQTVHPALTVKTALLGNKENDESEVQKTWQVTHWQPMLQFTNEILATSNKANCSSRLLGVASKNPLRFRDIAFETVKCPEGADIPESATGIYRDYDGKLINGNQALKDFLHFKSVHFYGELLAFYAPYFELKKTGSKLWTVDELIKRKAPINEKTVAENWMGQYTDIANVEIAQEAIYSGAFLAKEIAQNVLKKSQFGDIALDPARLTAYDKWRNCIQRLENNLPLEQDKECPKNSDQLWAGLNEELRIKNFLVASPGGTEHTQCKALKPGLPEGKYFAATCLMEINPIFRHNVSTFLVLQALENSRELNSATKKTPDGNYVPNESAGQFTEGTETAYRVAYYYNNPYWMAKLLPGLPLEWGNDKDGKDGMHEEGWYIRLRHHTGKRWYIPLPSPYVIMSGMVTYSPIMGEAREYRNRIMERYLFHSMHRHVAIDKNLSTQAKSQAQKLMHQIALYSRDTVIAGVMATATQQTLTSQTASSASKKRQGSQTQASQQK